MTFSIADRALRCDLCFATVSPEEYDRLMGGGKPGSFREPGTPDLIIPFERTAEDFRKAFESAVEERYFADLGFIRKFHTAAVRAVYAPFRICDFWISGDICYTSEDVRSRNGGGYLHVFHECRTSGSLKLLGVTEAAFSGTASLPRDPGACDLSEARAFSPAWLAGMYAEPADQEFGDSYRSATERAEKEFENFLSSSAQHAGVRINSRNIIVKPWEEHCVYFPFLIADVVWKGRNCRLIINGHSGKFSGYIPSNISSRLVWMTALWFLSDSFVLLIAIDILSGSSKMIQAVIIIVLLGLGLTVLGSGFLCARCFGQLSVALLSAPAIVGLGIYFIISAVGIFRTAFSDMLSQVFVGGLAIVVFAGYLVAGMRFVRKILVDGVCADRNMNAVCSDEFSESRIADTEIFSDNTVDSGFRENYSSDSMILSADDNTPAGGVS